MKRYIVFVLAVFLLLACSGLKDTKYRIQHDEFKNQSNASFSQHLKPIEMRTGIGTMKVTYQREMDVKEASLKFFAFVSRVESSFPIETKAFVKSNGQTFEIFLDLQKSEYKTSTSTKTNTTTKDSETATLTETNSAQYYIDKFVVNLSSEAVSSILQTNKLVYRFYFGPEMITYKLSSYQLNQLKGLLRK